MPTTHLARVVREFTTTIANPYDRDELLHRLMEHATAVTGAQGAGVMLTGPDGLAFAAASSEAVVDIEILQGRIESGACHEAFTTDTRIVVDDLEGNERWPAYRSRALQLGFRAVLAVPMRVGGRTVGVVNIYRSVTGPWSDDEVAAAEIITAMGTGYVLHADQLEAQQRLADQLAAALRSRDIIGQAKGMLMARHDVDADQAFAMLRSVSQRTNLKLRDVAAKLTETEGASVGA